MTKSLVIAAVLGLVSFLCSYRFLPGLVHAQVANMTVPLQATLVEKMFSDTGALTIRKSRQYARFSDHSTYLRTEEEYPAHAIKIVEILNVSANTWIDLDATTSSASTFRYAASPSSIKDHIAGLASESCADIDLSKATISDVMFGYKTMYVRDTPDSAWTRERWVAPDLNCFPLKRIDALSGGARDEELATKLVVGEPPNALLSVPFGFIERDPATIEELHKQATNGEVFWGPEILHLRKKDYLKNK